MGAIGRILDILFAVYFVVHIPLAVFIDSQMVVPARYYPKWALDFGAYYARTYKDAFMTAAPIWMQSFIVMENTIQVPFFFVAAYAFFKGGCRWIRTPILMYGSSTATMLVPIMTHIMLNDYGKDPHHPGPSNMNERLFLLAAYIPFFIYPVIMVLRMLLDHEYCGKVKTA